MAMSALPSEPRLVVLAGNYREFLFWCRENECNPRDRNLIYASDPSRLRGLGPVRWISYGTAYLRRDYWEMREYLTYLERRYQCPEQKPDGTQSETPSLET
jgi:hypothetical protein